ncbi:MAG: response regulator [Planctomycetes bacterium]|nr:response regulator [Planctomycetota bacterium]
MIPGSDVLHESADLRPHVLAEALPQLVWTARPDGWANYFNTRWLEYTGLSLEQSQGWGWHWAVHPEDLSACLDRWQQALATGKPLEIENRLRAAHGAWRWFLVRGVPIRDPQGRILQWLGTCTDIDDQKPAQATLREADRRKDEFLAVLAHELRNPLAPITHALEVLRQVDNLNEDGAQARAVIERQTRQMTQLISDLLDLSRISKGKIHLRPERVDLARVAAGALESVHPLVLARRHDLKVSLPSEPVFLWVDPTRLEQVLTNLLNNAAKYTEPGGKIELLGRREGNEVVLSVRDNGLGIAREVLPHLFEPFMQAQGALPHAQGGLGIGLNLVRTLVELHGGQVDAHSAGPGQGSEFVVRLPVPRERAAAKPSPVPNASTDGSPRRRILLVDDNVDAAETLALWLTLQGHQVLTAADGPSALELAQTHLPEVGILDLGLPGMDGLEVGRQLRASLPPPLFLIAQTGYGRPEDRRQALAAGFDAHLVKPVPPEELGRILASLPGTSS